MGTSKTACKAAGATTRKKRTTKKPFAIDVHSHIDVPEAKAMIDRLHAPPGGRPSFGIRERPDEQLLVPGVLAEVVGDEMKRHGWNLDSVRKRSVMAL